MPAFPKKWLIVLLALGVVVPLLNPLLPDLVSDYRLFLVSTMIIAAIAVLGLNLLTGFNGQISLGHGAFYAVGAVAGIMVAHIVYLDPNMMSGILLYAFASALVGGIGNPGGAVVGGFIVGVLENMVAFAGNQIEKATGVYIIGNGEKLTVALIIVIFVLTVKPAGLFGRVVVKRV